MELSLSEDQVALQDNLQRFLLAAAPISVVREAEPLGFSPSLWSKFASLGLVAMTASPALGGEGARLLDVALVCEQLGRHLAPVPFIETVVAARTLERAGSDLAALLIDGPACGTVALLEAIDGVAGAVPAGAVAEVVVALDGDDLVAVRGPAAPGGQRHTLGCLPLADRSTRSSDVVEFGVLLSGADARREHERSVMEWRALTAAALVGLAEGALAIAVAYVKERKQFGVAIGSFQSVSHRLADCATALEGARLLAREAAWATDASPGDAAFLTQMAFAFAAETAQHIAGESLHFHGGYGYMLEYDIQLFFSRAKAWALVGGNPHHLYLSIADGLIGDPGQETSWISR